MNSLMTISAMCVTARSHYPMKVHFLIKVNLDPLERVEKRSNRIVDKQRACKKRSRHVRSSNVKFHSAFSTRKKGTKAFLRRLIRQHFFSRLLPLFFTFYAARSLADDDEVY